MKKVLLSMAVAGVAAMPVASQAGSLNANVAVAADYWSKGTDQTDTIGMLKGDITYSMDNGLYAGVWAGTLDKGYEFDYYVGYNRDFGEVNFDLSYMSIDVTDDVYGKGMVSEEVIVGLGYGIFSARADFDVDADNADYVHYKGAVDISEWANGMSLTYGIVDYSDSATQDKRYFEATYATEVDKGLGLTVDFINSTSTSGALNVTLSKSFDLM